MKSLKPTEHVNLIEESHNGTWIGQVVKLDTGQVFYVTNTTDEEVPVKVTLHNNKITITKLSTNEKVD